MRDAEADRSHPGRLELTLYARGRLERGHAVAVLAHSVACARCGPLLATLVARALGAPRQPGEGREDHEWGESTP